MIKEVAICTPEEYYSEEMQQLIKTTCAHEEKQWIYKILDNTHDPQTETIFIRNADWVLCQNIHPGTDKRYLIIFTDCSLRTIRDLRMEHVKMLMNAQQEVTRFLNKCHPDIYNKFSFFFHYLPSVFQLHAHVSVRKLTFNVNRRQPFQTVIRNLLHDSEYYKKALFLTNVNREVKNLNVYSSFVL
jgi:diadenosine tetraphosphate (Ap4A) HIT family hydrolase